MALAYTDVQVEIREISLQNRPEELYEVSKKGTVPVLITIDGLVIDESLEIILWALKNNLNQTWLIENHNKEIEMINRNDILFKKWLDRYKYHDRYPENSKEYYRKKYNTDSTFIAYGANIEKKHKVNSHQICHQNIDLCSLINH